MSKQKNTPGPWEAGDSGVYAPLPNQQRKHDKMSIQLTDANYHSQEANRAYMSSHQLADWVECPAMAAAKLRGDWKQPETPALVIGSYVDVLITQPDKAEAFREKHPEMIAKSGKNKGALKSDYIAAEAMVESVKRQPVAWRMLTGGTTQQYVTGDIAGMPFRGAVDALNLERLVFFDLKTAKDFEDAWDKPEKRYFAWCYRYRKQMAIYRELLRQMYGDEFSCGIVGVRKKAPYQVSGWLFRDTTLDRSLQDVESDVDAIRGYVEGWADPTGEYCGKCAYCAEHAPFGFVEV